MTFLENMTFSEISILIIVIVLSVIAIRITLNFDVNKFLENSRKISMGQLKGICPHMEILDVSESRKTIKYGSLFTSPPGTINWICSQCGLIVNSEDDVYRNTEIYKKNPSLILEKQRKFLKEAKKLKII